MKRPPLQQKVSTRDLWKHCHYQLLNLFYNLRQEQAHLWGLPPTTGYIELHYGL